MSRRKGHSRGKVQGRVDPSLSTMQELGLTKLEMKEKLSAPPPMFPLIQLPIFAWEQHDAYLVDKQRALETEMASSAFHVTAKDERSDIHRYSDRWAGPQRRPRVTNVLQNDLYTSMYPAELAIPPWSQRVCGDAPPVPLRRPKIRRRNSYDEELTVLEQQEGKDGSDEEEGGDIKLNRAESYEDFADDDDNDYVQNYYESDDEGGNAPDEGATFS